MADNDTSSKVTTEQVKLVLTVVSTFGLGSILLVVIGRLWTIAYFEHFGLSAPDLEFSIEDFAFRSLEVLISLGLAGLGLLLASRAKSLLESAGIWWLVGELLFVTLGATFMLAGGLDWLVSQWPWLATTTGVLGMISGIFLIVMILLVADIWFGSGTEKPHDGENSGTLGAAIAWLKTNWRRLAYGQTPQAPRERRNRGTLRAVIGWLKRNWHELLARSSSVRRLKDNWQRLLAGSLMVVIVFIYLPLVTEELAALQAEIDLKEGDLPAAILEAVKDPLPAAIASDADPNKSVAVRVILTQSQNTYVLNSTQCTAIGELKVERTEEGTFTKHSNVCKVFAIPTSRLKSIEYRSVDGSPPPNDTPFLAENVDLSEPFDVTVSTIGASDDEDIHCRSGQEGTSFFKTIWYAFTSPAAGTVLVSATSLERDPKRGDQSQELHLEPIVGVWEGSEQGELLPDPSAGSGPGDRACEEHAAVLRSISQGPGAVTRVATIANVQGDRTYFVGIGVQDDRNGDIDVQIEFMPDGFFFYGSTIPIDMRPKIEFASAPGQVQLEIRAINRDTYQLQKFDGDATIFALISDDGEVVHFVRRAEDNQVLTLDAEHVLDPGRWRLKFPFNFVGHVRLVSTTVQPDLVIALDDPSAAQLNDVRVQGALLLAIDPAKIRDRLSLKGSVIVDAESFDPDARTFETGENAVATARELLDQAEIAEEFPVQIQVEPETEEERDLLPAAAEILRQQLLGIGLDVVIAPCKDVCIRVFFRSEAL